ncbi:Krueppel-related zinc finger protein 1 [Holothuria leucospilota]|uniref:Krueppel-related zinc finger protein 1 n=1 Tax=Holothuria leucospilota TaxID=206669 RepID=A0A9Q0YFR5_HOLLE|nr:Krueppel-related zinc finger protein 1 [Holothuria leucospilota]
MAFMCSLCPKGFKLKHQLQRHLVSVHVSEGKHVCKTCQRSFSRQDALMRHQRKHEVDEITHTCKLCDQMFLRTDNLLRHMKTHENTKSPHKRPRSNSPNPQGIDVADKQASRFGNTHHEPPRKRQRTIEPVEHQLHQENMRLAKEPNISPQFGTVINKDALTNQHPSVSDVGTFTEPDVSPTEHLPIIAKDSDIIQSSSTVTWQEEPLVCPEDVALPNTFGSAEHCDTQGMNKLYKQHWRDIRTRFQTRGKLRNTYNFRLHTFTIEEVMNAAKQIFDKQETAFKINLGFGFFLRNVETCQLQYYYASNNTRLLPEPMLVTGNASFTTFLNTLSTKDPADHVRLARPNSRWVVETVTNAIFYVFKLRDHPIGGATRLPEFITNNKAVVSLEKDRNNNHRYEDNLCLFRCLALHKGAKVKAVEKKAMKLYRQMYSVKPKHFAGVPLSKLHDVETLFKLNIVVYEMVQISEESDKSKQVEKSSNHPKLSSELTVRLIRRSLERYDDTMYLNLCGDHFSYIQDINMYSKSYQCKKCQKLGSDRRNLLKHEAACKGNGVKHTFPGGVYSHPKTVFELLEEEGICIPADLRYYPYRAVYDFECCFETVQEEKATSKLTLEASHVPLSVSVCSNVPGYEEPMCFISEGRSDELLQNMLCYVTEISEKSSDLLREVYQPHLQEIESRIAAEKEAFEKLCEERKKQAKPRQHYLQVLHDKLVAYLNELPVLGFNSGKYDVNSVKQHLFPWLVENDPLKFIVKRCNNYMSVKSKHLLFLDVVNFIAPGFSYDAFLKAYECSQSKGFFPYEWINFENLADTSLPPHEAFYSDLKKSNITTDEYAYCQNVWEQENMQTMKDFLTWYNNRDVVPFLEALEKMAQFYRERYIDVFKDGISVPGLTMKYLFQKAKSEPFALFDKKNKDLYYTFRANLVGGPSIIFHRHQEKGKTKIRNTDNVCQKIVGFDANALYLWAIMQNMPTGPFLRRREETGFNLEKSRPVSNEWLHWKAYKENIFIRHQGNDKEKRVGLRRIPVDGFCQETNTVYQFHGCFVHGHDCYLTQNKSYSIEEQQKFITKRQNTDNIRDYIKSLGYNYEEIRQCEFYREQETSQELQHFLHILRLPLERVRKLSQKRIVQAIRDDLIFGAIECDIHVPDELKPKFAEMCPIFKNTDISVDDIGKHMKNFAMEGNIMTKPRKSLIGSMFGEKILLATPLVKWYLDHGLQITRIYQVIEFTPKSCFKTFGEAVSDARREGDRNPSKAIIADTMKLIGNSSYGKTITNKEGHCNINIVQDDKASRLINETTFRDLNEISTGCYEVESAKRSIAMDLPIQIGFFVYQYAKLRMLEFYYDFLDKYFDRQYWEYVEMDTDSAYIAIAAEKLDDLVKPELKEVYYKEKHHWFPRTDTEEHKRYDKRTPGLFKVEWEGDGIVALNSKMYYCYGGMKDKFSCKGINKRRNEIGKDVYLRVLNTKNPITGKNKGFRVKDNRVFTYSQVKTGFTYFYPKRKVLENGVQTTYLDI